MGCTLEPMGYGSAHGEHGGNDQEPSMNPHAPAPVTAQRPDVVRIGRFSSGNEERPEAPAKLRIGRFSTGSERRAHAPAKLRRGSFADGSAAPWLISLQ